MKILHVTIPSKRMMETYIKMIRENYPKEEHVFYFLGKCPKSEVSLFEYGNVRELDGGKNLINKVINFYKDLNKHDYIIWHGLVLNPKFALFLNFFPHILDKSVWVMWGIDLYEWKRKPVGFKSKFINYLNKRLRKKIGKVVAIFKTDIDAYKSIFSNKSKEIFYAPYPIRRSVFLELESSEKVLPRLNNEIWIQVGNNANSFNNHLDILSKLRKFSNEPIKIFIPMSYGNDWHNKIDNYVDIVREKAIEWFGEDKVYVLKNLMSIDEYSKFLEQIDIMVIATNRQNALGNITKNLYAGGKVFLSEKNPLYDYFNNNHIKINRYEDIDDMSFSDFIKTEENIVLKEWLIENCYPEKNLFFWDNIFMKLSGMTDSVDKSSFARFTNEIISDMKNNARKKIKSNYINLSKYMYKNKNMLAKLKNATSIVIAGTDDSSLKVAINMFEQNKLKYMWNFMGVIDYEMIDLKERIFGLNTVSTISSYNSYENVKVVNFTDGQYVREKIYKDISLLGGTFSNVVLPYSKLGNNFSYEVAFHLGSYGVINNNCKLGKFVKLGDSIRLGENCIVGDYVNIDAKVIVGRNCIIGNYVDIGSNVIVGDNCIINDGVVIKANTVVKDNTLL